jgi:aspartyl-tRNA(Asn)/glutamyl-tRNA(Gln) amidotransferase subunit C
VPLTDKDVNHVARLARLALTDEERTLYRGQLEKILGHMTALAKYDTSRTPPTTHTAGQVNRGREDVPRLWENTEAILANAPEREEMYFKVKKVIE